VETGWKKKVGETSTRSNLAEQRVCDCYLRVLESKEKIILAGSERLTGNK